MKDIIRKVKNCLATKEPVRFNSEELGIILASLEMARAVPYLLKSMEPAKIVQEIDTFFETRRWKKH